MPDADSQVTDVLTLNRRDYQQRITIALDVELLESIDARRGGVSRSDYIERVLFAAMQRVIPHLPDGWTPEQAADELHERMLRHAKRDLPTRRPRPTRADHSGREG